MSAQDGEHEGEPIRGLPGHLPEGERILWQGTSDWRALARRALRLRWVGGYFAALAAWSLATGLAAGQPAAALAVDTLLPVVAGAGVVGLFALYAWGVARTTVYTLTNRRVVFRHGVALSKAVNVPFAQIDSAELRLHGAGVGDVPLKLIEGVRVPYPHLWPHVRPWRFSRPEPMLRCVHDAAVVAGLLAEALRDFHPAAAEAAVISTSAPSRPVRARRPAAAAAGGPVPA